MRLAGKFLIPDAVEANVRLFHQSVKEEPSSEFSSVDK